MAEGKGELDLAVDILKERLNDARALIKERYKGIRPFRQPKIPDRELLYNYLKSGYETFSNLADTQGPQAALKWQGEMEKLKEKFNG